MGHEIYRFGIPFLGHHYCIISLSDLPRSKEEYFQKKIYKFYTFYPKLTSLGGGGMEFTISCLLTLQMLHNKFGKDWQSFLRRDVNTQQMLHDHGSQPIDSGDLKIV